MAELQIRVDELSVAEDRVTELEEQITTLETELSSVSGHPCCADEQLRKRPRGSTGSMEEAEKSIRGYHHIVNEMKEENSALKTANAELSEEINILKEEIKLLQEITDNEPKSNGGDVSQLRTQISQQADVIKDYEREVSELESLIESKIYREDELETRVQELESQLSGQHKVNGTSSHVRNESTSSTISTASQGTTRSTQSNGTTGTDTRCELCEGPHDLDACPVFTGATLEAGNTSPLSIKKKKWCADCESSAHDTSECPMADDVF